MLEFYALYIFSMLLSSLNSVYLYKKFQLTAGTSLQANTMYLIINGVVSAIVPGILMIVRGQPLECTPYSLIVALIIMVCAAANTAAQLKAYSLGKIATVNILATVGSIILSCAWGVLVLRETLTFFDVIAIGLMLLSTLLIRGTDQGGKQGKGILWLYGLVILFSSIISILNKQHQVEATFETVDTLSFSVWIGIIRTVIFTGVALIILAKSGKSAFAFSRASVGYATASSVISGSCYIITLFTGTVLPIVVTSPLGTGLGIIMSSILPWVFYKERLSRRQIIGILFSLSGAILFLVG
ncbi:MAG: hypothetical protein IJF34_02905 [Clostridia bacterium]|nr:hypothetical protein [Clostridia bacterium]